MKQDHSTPEAGAAPRSLREAGMSLSEILVVVAIIGMFAAVSVPSFKNMSDSARIRNASVTIRTSLGMARRKAVTLRRPVRVSFDFAGDRFAGYILDSTDEADISDPNHWMPVNHRWLPMQLPATPYWLPVDADLKDSTTNSFNDIDSDGLIDVVFLRNGSLATTGSTTLSFSPPPEIVVEIAGSYIAYNLYRFQGRSSGKIEVIADRG